MCAGLDGHHCQIAPSRLREQGCQIGCVLGVDQSARVDRQHDAVEVEATHCRQLGGGGAEVVAGDADEAREALVAGTQNGLDGWAPTIELGHVGDAVSLVQVERVAAESLQRRLELCAQAIGVGAIRLLADEQPGPHGRDERAHHQLGMAVGRRDVEMVDARIERQLEAAFGDLGGGAPEGGAAEDGE